MPANEMSSGDFVTEITAQNFQADVVEKSQQVPVIMEFYAEGAAPSDELSKLLGTLIPSYQGKLSWARVNVQANQQLVQQLGVRGLPTLKVVKGGQLLDNLEGPQTQAALSALFDQLTMSEGDQIRAQIAGYLSVGDRESAMAMLREMMVQEPLNASLKTELCDSMIQANQIQEAEALLASLPNDAEGIEKAKSRLHFVQQVSELGTIETLEALAISHPDDQSHLYHFACALVAADQIEAGLQVLLDMLRRDKSWSEDKARQTMIRVFELLGKGDPMASTYRRKMFTLMH
jgi:putative thioredoxin